MRNFHKKMIIKKKIEKFCLQISAKPKVDVLCVGQGLQRGNHLIEAVKLASLPNVRGIEHKEGDW
jgi:hypothetical protein